MPQPLPGMVPIAEFGNRFAADLASARLFDSGIDSAVLGDPAASVAPHHVTERWFSLCVRVEVAEDAREVLDERADGDGDHSPPTTRVFRDRPRWIRWATWALILAVPTPLIVSLLLVVLVGLRALFP